MATGNYPTTVTAELNRLANGGTYPTSPINYKGNAGAANAWAGTTGYETVGALNKKAGNAAAAYLDLDGVCNQLAGTTGLGAPEALRRIVS